MPWELIIIFLIVLIGSFIQGSTGFGFGLFAMGFLPMFLPVKDSTLLVISLTTILTFSIIVRLFKYVELKSLWFILTFAFTGRILSFLFLTSFGEMDSMKRLLGFFLIGMVIYLTFSNNKGTTKAIHHPLAPIILGFIGGFIGGVFAVGGPFFVVYFLTLYKDKLNYNANLQVTLFLMSLFTLSLHTVNGDISTSILLYASIGLLAVFIGTSIGFKLFKVIPRERILKSAMFIVLLAGLNLVIFV